MRKLHRTETRFTLKELKELAGQHGISKGAYEKALEWIREDEPHDDWYDYELWGQALEQVGFTNAEINFTGFWSQGDGASFTSGLDLELLASFLTADPWEVTEGIEYDAAAKRELFVPWVRHKLDWKPLNDRDRRRFRHVRELVNYCREARCRRDHYGGHYVHEGTCSIELEFNFPGREVVEETKCGDRVIRDRHWETRAGRLDQLAEDFEALVEELREALCKRIYQDLEEEHDYLTSDEALEELAAGNGWEFDESGYHLGSSEDKPDEPEDDDA
jgi:hypothetical protein